MQNSTLFREAHIVNEGEVVVGDVLVMGDRIAKVGKNLEADDAEIVNAKGMWLMPGIIDDQVHFREPGLTHKAEIFTESMAAVAGGVTTYMEMPNTIPNATTIHELEKKYDIAKRKSFANYSFYLGATNNNMHELNKLDKKKICGLKIFMGSSTGNMLVDKEKALNEIFKNSEVIITTHCEDEITVQENLRKAVERYGENIPIEEHPKIRSREACYKSSSRAIELAKDCLLYTSDAADE